MKATEFEIIERTPEKLKIRLPKYPGLLMLLCCLPPILLVFGLFTVWVHFWVGMVFFILTLVLFVGFLFFSFGYKKYIIIDKNQNSVNIIQDFLLSKTKISIPIDSISHIAIKTELVTVPTGARMEQTTQVPHEHLIFKLSNGTTMKIHDLSALFYDDQHKLKRLLRKYIRHKDRLVEQPGLK